MSYKRSKLQYWNTVPATDTWADAETASSQNALISVELMDGLGAPMSCIARLSNRPATPFNDTAASRKGPLTGIFTDFMTIRVIDDESQAILFMGTIFNIKESYDIQYGNVIELTARDGLAELRDNPTSGSHGFTIDASASANVTVNPESATSEHTKLFTTGMAYRSDIIKSLINLNSRWNYTSNVPYNFDYSDTDRFITSVSAYRDDGEYKLSAQSQKAALSHIASLAAEDPTALTQTLPTAFTYDYYLDPNSKNPLATNKSTPHFNYFKRGQRPHTNATPDPATYGFKLEFGGSSSDGSWGSTTSDGRQDVMLADFDLERPKTELFTDALVNYTDTQVADTADLSKGGSVSGATSTKRTVRMEIIKIRDIASGTVNGGNPTGLWTNLQKSPIAETGTSLIESGTSTSANCEYLENTSGTKVARLQYLSATSGGSASVPEYAIISEVTSAFPDSADAELRHRAYGIGGNDARFYLVSRPAAEFGTRRTFITNASNATRPDEVRELVASKLMRSAKEVVRGRFRTLRKPLYYIDNSPGSVSGSQADQTITCASSVRPYTYGFRTGMTVNKLSSGEPSAVFGQAISVQSGADTSHIYWSTGTAATSDTLRYYVPIRAGDLIYVRNETIGITGMKMLVTKIHYAEQPGVASMTLDVVGSETKAEGGWAKKHLGAAVAQATEETIELPPSVSTGSVAAQPIGGQAFSTNLRFYSTYPDSTDATIHRHIRWGLNTNKAADATIKMAGGITATIAKGGDQDAGDDGPYALVAADGTITAASTAHLTEGETYTAFLDFKQQPGTATKTVYLTEHVGIPYGDHIVRLAYIIVPASGTGNNSPTVMPITAASSIINAETIECTTLSAVSADMGSLTSGRGIFGENTGNFNSGASGAGSGFTGVALGEPGTGTNGIGDLFTLRAQNDGDDQVYIKEGKLYAGAGNIALHAGGISIGNTDDASLQFTTTATGSRLLEGRVNDGDATQFYWTGYSGLDEIVWSSLNFSAIASLQTNNSNGFFIKLPGSANAAAAGDYLDVASGSGTIGSPYQTRFQNAKLIFNGTSSSMTSSYGIFRYAYDGNENANDTLAFTHDHQDATPDGDTAQSVFWIMQSIGNFLHFEPNLAYGTSNYAWIGNNNPLVGVRGYYLQAGGGSASYPSISFYADTNTGFYSSTSDTISLTFGGTERFQFSQYGLYPKTDDYSNLGSPSLRFDNIYATNGTINTSDTRDKVNINPIPLGLDFIKSLNPISYKWKTKPEKQTHYGILAQEVLETLKDYGIDSIQDFGGITGDESTRYGARYTEFVPILIKAIQELSDKIKKLEGNK